MKFEVPAVVSSRFAKLRSSALLPYIVLAVSLITTAVFWYVLKAQTDASARAEFENEARQSVAKMRDEILSFQEVLQAGAGLIVASDSVSRDEWQRFVDRLDLLHVYPGIETLIYAQHVLPNQLAALEARVRADGNANFRVWPEGVRQEYVVNVLVQPFGKQNPQALGFDLLSEPTRKRAVERARDTGTISISGLVKLVLDQAPSPRPALLMFAPVYRSDSAPQSVEERRLALIGYVSAAFHIEDLMSDVLGDHALPLSVAIYEGDTIAPASLIYETPRNRQILTKRHDARFTTDVRLALATQHWIVRFAVNRNAKVALQGTQPLVALAVGVPLSLLLFGLAWSETSLRTRATSIAREMTKEIHEQAQLLDLTHDTIFLRDSKNVIRYWNRAANDTYGFTADEAIGRTADDLLKTRFPVPLAAVWEELAQTGHW
jgi:CHASE1-domain containing sensor protein